MKERWEKLLTPKRFRESSTIRDKMDRRNPFENDYSRIILSAPLRRLQNKTQVFPLEENDFIRTRLTHSLEVSNFARSLGLSIEKLLIERKKLHPKHDGDLSSILSCAGLIHDIGNPPFGHFGEQIIQKYFTKHFEDKRNIEHFSIEELADFQKFDGNAQSFRLVRKLHLSKDEFSLNLTYPVLASILKYPHDSINGNNENKGLSFSKFGYFQTEKEDFESINHTLELQNRRHPLVYILEAADDIAYSVADIEDGCKKGIIDKDILFDHFNTELKDSINKKFISIMNDIDKAIPVDFPNRTSMLIQNIRVKAQSQMLIHTVDSFIANHDAILDGSFDEDIVLVSKSKCLRKAFKKLSLFNFSDQSVLRRELLGEKTLNFLLQLFTESVLSDNKLKPKTKEAKVYKLLSDNYKYIQNNFSKYPNETYKNLQIVVDYISGMTDKYAYYLYRQFSGIIIH